MRIGVVTAGLALAAWWVVSSYFDPSDGHGDTALCDALERSLLGGLDPPVRSGASIFNQALKLESMPEPEFRRRVDAVKGGDLLRGLLPV